MGRIRFAEVIAVDSSAILAIVLQEPERGVFIRRIIAEPKALISTVSIVEVRIVLKSRRGDGAVLMANEAVREHGIELVPPAAADVEAAYLAFVMFGKGRGHPAQLNFGDLFSYALAKTRDLPLLYKGNDFAKTDIRSALG